MLSNRAPVLAAPNSANGCLIDTMPFRQHGACLCGLVNLSHLVAGQNPPGRCVRDLVRAVTVFVVDVLLLAAVAKVVDAVDQLSLWPVPHNSAVWPWP